MPAGWRWATWLDPLAYAVQALIANEFSASRWAVPYEYADPGDSTTLGQAALQVRAPAPFGRPAGGARPCRAALPQRRSARRSRCPGTSGTPAW